MASRWPYSGEMRTSRVAVTFLALLVAASAARGGVNHSVFTTIIQHRVTDEGLVDYPALKRTRFDLLVYLDLLANADAKSMTRDEQLAYYINLYNATVLDAISERYHENYSPADNDYELFKTPLVRIDGKTITLNQLENDIIRPTFKDPRVHAALVCGARSCPPLLRRAYTADDLNATLDANMKRFVNDPARNRIDRAAKRLTLSKIFEWNAADFGGKEKLPTYLSKYIDGGSVEGFAVEFMDYDWTVNAKP
jgi:hypothetical protein